MSQGFDFLASSLTCMHTPGCNIITSGRVSTKGTSCVLSVHGRHAQCRAANDLLFHLEEGKGQISRKGTVRGLVVALPADVTGGESKTKLWQEGPTQPLS